MMMLVGGSHRVFSFLLSKLRRRRDKHVASLLSPKPKDELLAAYRGVVSEVQREYQFHLGITDLVMSFILPDAKSPENGRYYMS